MKEFIESIGWQIQKEHNRVSGQAKIYFVVNENGDEGVFRKLNFKKNNSKFNHESIKRFHREIKVLRNDEGVNNNIVRILEHGESPDIDLYWYITQKGEPFADWWEAKIKGKDGAEIVNLAIDVITQIATGLSIAHENGIVHRDIKPDNLVVINDTIKIIDWGICHIQGAERITNIDYPAYNRAFSPSYLYFHRDNIPSWVDIFQLSQLLIFLLKEDTKKTGFAPIHWKWVVYRETISEEHILKSSIFLHRCSSEFTCPKDGNEAIELINNIFTKTNRQNNMNELDSLFSTLKLKSVESDTSIRSKIEHLPIDIAPAVLMYNQFVEEIDKRIKLFKNSSSEIRIERKNGIDSSSLYKDEHSWKDFLIGRLNNPNSIGGNDYGMCIEFGIEPIKTVRVTIIFTYDIKNEFSIVNSDIKPKLKLLIDFSYQNRRPLPMYGYSLSAYIIDPTLLITNTGERINFNDVIDKVISTIESSEIWNLTAS